MHDEAAPQAPPQTESFPAPAPCAAPEPYAAPADASAQPGFPAMPASPDQWRYRPPRTPSWWHRHARTVRLPAIAVVLALCGVVILALVREQTGTDGLIVGLLLALLPVPVLVAAFRWVDGVEPKPWSRHVVVFGWGACAATLIALLANTFTTAWLAGSVAGSASEADLLGATVVAPVVEEVAKAIPVVLLFFFRRRHFTGVVSGIAVAGLTAAGFAFTENVLYLGRAYGGDDTGMPYEAGASATAATFIARILMSPFAHPLFTGLTGVAFGIAAAMPHWRRRWRAPVATAGLLTAILLHAIWNGAASQASLTFLFVYALFMLPVLGTLIWLAVWSRLGELRTVRETLPMYVAAGWIAAPEAWALGTPRARSLARDVARQGRGPEAARTVAEYQHFATSLALLRARAERGIPVDDFHAREQELLHHLWTRRATAAPPTQRAAASLSRPLPPPRPPGGPGGPYGPPGPYRPPGPYGGPGPYAPPGPHGRR